MQVAKLRYAHYIVDGYFLNAVVLYILVDKRIFISKGLFI